VARKVAVVDDDREVREFIGQSLEDLGYEVKHANNGLRLVSTLHVDRPDLILLDVMMSWIDGFELCRAMKRNADYAKIPVVFVSAKSSPADIQHGLACGAVDYIAKPFDLPLLLDKIEQIIGPP